MPPPQAIICSVCGGKFFKQSYPIHLERCKEKFTSSHTQCEQCGLQIQNSDWAEHKSSCKVSPRSKKRMLQLKAQAAAEKQKREALIKRVEEEQRALEEEKKKVAALVPSQPTKQPDTSNDSGESLVPGRKGISISAVCQECEDAKSEVFCQDCEQSLCANCSSSLHKKGARARHITHSLTDDPIEEARPESPVTGTASNTVFESKVPLQHPSDNALGPQADLGEVDRTPCRICDRKFATDRLYIHERVCAKIEEKNKAKKRKVWDGAARRVKDTEFAQFAKKRPPTPPEVKEWRAHGRRWREEAKQFHEVIETNKAITEMKAAGLIVDPPKAKLRDTVGMSGLSKPDEKSLSRTSIGKGGGGSGAAAAWEVELDHSMDAVGSLSHQPKVRREPTSAVSKAKASQAKPAPTSVAPSNSTSNISNSSRSSTTQRGSCNRGDDVFRLEREKRERARRRASAEQTKRQQQQETQLLQQPAKVSTRSEHTNRMVARERGEQAMAAVKLAQTLAKSTTNSASKSRRSSGSSSKAFPSSTAAPISENQYRSSRISGSRSSTNFDNTSKSKPVSDNSNEAPKSPSLPQLTSSSSNLVVSSSSVTSFSVSRSEESLTLPRLPSFTSLEQSLPGAAQRTAADSKAHSMADYLERERTRAALNGRYSATRERQRFWSGENSIESNRTVLAQVSAPLSSVPPLKPSSQPPQPIAPSDPTAALAFEIPASDDNQGRRKTMPKLSSSEMKKGRPSPGAGLRFNDGIAKVAPGPQLKATMVGGKIQRILVHPQVAGAPIQETNSLRSARASFLERLQAQQAEQ